VECLSPNLTDVSDPRITEAVATTLSSKKGENPEPNAAPMGVLKENGNLYARLWEGSKTLENVRSTNEVVVNITHDPVVYVEGALGDPSRFVETHGSEERIARLCQPDAWFVCNTDWTHSESSREEVTKWKLEQRRGKVLNRRVPAHSRGFASVIEATVHATRLEFKPGLRELYDHHLEVAENCGGDREREAVDMLRSYVDG